MPWSFSVGPDFIEKLDAIAAVRGWPKGTRSALLRELVDAAHTAEVK